MSSEEKNNSKGLKPNMKSELKKVIWPTGKQTVRSTAVTIGFVLLISAILIIFNLFFDFLSDSYYKLIFGTDENNNQGQEVIVSGDQISGDLSGDASTISGETVSTEISGDSTEGTEVE